MIAWDTKVAPILMGLAIRVYLAHRVALRRFWSQHEEMVSQLPMLVRMVAQDPRLAHRR